LCFGVKLFLRLGIHLAKCTFIPGAAIGYLQDQ
jgi:hypothetical protein